MGCLFQILPLHLSCVGTLLLLLQVCHGEGRFHLAKHSAQNGTTDNDAATVGEKITFADEENEPWSLRKNKSLRAIGKHREWLLHMERGFRNFVQQVGQQEQQQQRLGYFRDGNSSGR